MQTKTTGVRLSQQMIRDSHPRTLLLRQLFTRAGLHLAHPAFSGLARVRVTEPAGVFPLIGQ